MACLTIATTMRKKGVSALNPLPTMCLVLIVSKEMLKITTK